jgi:hypothetical protein
MNIIKQKWEFLNTLTPLVPKQAKNLFRFGYEVLVSREIKSLRANSRLALKSWYASKMNIYRLTSNKKMADIFVSLLRYLSIVTPESIVIIDFSDFGNGFQVLMFAIQTRKGRAIPVYFEILKYPIRKGSQNLFIIAAIRNFTGITGMKPHLVFDRGFACPMIIQFLAKNQYKFTIRVKKSKSVIDARSGNQLLAYNHPDTDAVVFAYGFELRLIISELKPEINEPWYLITNDIEGSRETIIKQYYHRFEIEEFFRDAKRLLGMEYVNFKKMSSLNVILWFSILGMWLAWTLEKKMTEQQHKEKKMFKLSTFRYYFEKIQKEIILAAEEVFMRQSSLELVWEKV